MTRVFLFLVVGLGGAAVYFAVFAKNSFSSYSSEQLTMLEQAFTEVTQPTEDQLYSQELLEAEKQRRVVFPALVAGALLAAVGAYLMRRRATYVGASLEESARFSASMGDPALVLEGARNKAATLLGVTRTAPAAVVEAALAAQLQTRDPTRLAGIAPELKAMVLEQREALIHARNLLLETSKSPK